MEWTKNLPTETGLYLFQQQNQWICSFGSIKKGDWTDRQNPEWFYFNGENISDLDGSWFGPIPQPPNKTH